MIVAVSIEEKINEDDNNKIQQDKKYFNLFKIFNIENGEIISTEIVQHSFGLQANLLVERNNINVIIYGNVPFGSQEWWSKHNVQVFSGIDGDADEVVRQFLKGKLS